MLDGGSSAAVGKTARSRVTNGRSLWLDGDQRSSAARRFRDVYTAIIGDLGGGDLLTEGQKQLARRCSLLAVTCELVEGKAVAGEEIDLEQYGQLTDRMGRAFQRLGLKRAPRDITPPLHKYLEQKAVAS
jgi:hypothetical protein